MHFRVQEGAERNSGAPPPPSGKPRFSARPKTPGSYPFDIQRHTPAPQTASAASGLFHSPLRLLVRVWSSFKSRLSAGQPTGENAWEAVAEAASIGEISEYDLFRAAWMAWYGTKAKDPETEKLFGACLNGAELPCHVRHFARQLRSAGNDPALSFDRARFRLDRYPRKEALILP